MITAWWSEIWSNQRRISTMFLEHLRMGVPVGQVTLIYFWSAWHVYSIFDWYIWKIWYIFGILLSEGFVEPVNQTIFYIAKRKQRNHGNVEAM